MRMTIRLWMAAISLAAIFCTRTAPQLSEIDAQPLAIQTTISIDSTATDPGSLEEAPISVCIGCDHTINYSSTDETTPEPTGPVVRAVMFWMNGCPSCHHVLENVLPPIQEQFGGQFELQLIELVGAEEYLHLVELAASLGVPKEQVYVPFMVLGEHALIGPDQIQAELPDLIEGYLAQGGLDWPAGMEQPEQISATATVESTTTFSGKVVRFIVFTTLECHSCRDELATALRPVVENYGDQIEYRTIDIRTSEDVEYLYQVAAGYGYEREYVDLPMAIIGEHLLMVEEIAAQLPDLVEGYLKSGGVDYPVMPELPGQPTATAIKTATYLPATPLPTATVVVASTEVEQPDGFVLAIVVMALMAAALVYAIARLVQAANRSAGNRTVPTWQTWLIPVLSILGLGVAGYLAYVETQLVHAVCGPVGDCNAVQSSPYARLFGVIPIGLLGIAGYLAILAVWLWGVLKRDRNSSDAALAVTGMALFGTLFSLYLTYLEPFVIQAVCQWCLASAIISTLLLLISLRPTTNAIYLEKQK